MVAGNQGVILLLRRWFGVGGMTVNSDTVD